MSKWDSANERQAALKELGERLQFNRTKDWYNLTRKDVIENGFHSLIKYYKQSPSMLVMSNIAWNWKPWLFKNLPRNFWMKSSNLVQYFEWLASELSITNPEQWYSVTSDILRQKYNFHKPLYDTLRIVYPQIDWKPWLFVGTPKRTWQNASTRKQYFNWLKTALDIKAHSDWYEVTLDTLVKFNSGGLLHRRYSSSVYLFVREHAPDYDWKPWLFKQVPCNYWKSIANRREYGEWLFNRVAGGMDSDGWYYITQGDFQANCGGAMLSMYYGGSPARFVMDNFPELNLDITQFKSRRKGQSKLYFLVKEIFPNEEILWEYKHDKIRSTHNRKLELDIFLPRLSLAFEYNGKQHFGVGTGFFKKTTDRIRENDEIKRKRCQELGIRLIEVPYTWSQTKDYITSLLGEKNV